MRIHRMHPRWFPMLRAVLLARAAIDLGFAWRIGRISNPSPMDLADAFAPFALLDGLAACTLAVVGFTARMPYGIVVLAATDAVLRLVAANALHFGPGISYFPMTIALYVGLLAAFAFAFGVIESLEARELVHEIGRKPISIALGVAGAATVALAVAQFAVLHDPSTFKQLLTAGIGLQALTLVAIGASLTAKTTSFFEHHDVV